MPDLPVVSGGPFQGGKFEYPAEVVYARAAEARAMHARMVTAEELVRAILEAVCVRDGLSLGSDVEPGNPARNFELALRLRIGHVFGLSDD